MKTKKKKEQFEIANVLFEMGMDFDVNESVAGVTPQELLLNKINILDFQEEIDDNNNDSYQESRNQRNEQTR